MKVERDLDPRDAKVRHLDGSAEENAEGVWEARSGLVMRIIKVL